MKKIYKTKFVFILVVILMTNIGNAAPRSPRSSKHTSAPTEKQITKRSVDFWNNLNTMFTSNSYQQLFSPWDSIGGPSVYYESNVLGLNDDNSAGINSIPSVQLDYMWPEQEMRHLSNFEEVPQRNNDRALVWANVGKDDTFNYILENDCDYDINGAGGSINDVYWNFPPAGIDESIFGNFYLVPDPIEKSDTIVENEVTTVQPIITTDKPAEEENKTPNVSIFNCFSDSGQKELVEKALSNKNDEYLVLLIKRNPFTDQKEPGTALQKPQSSQKELANKNIVGTKQLMETTTASPATEEEFTYSSETVKLLKTTTVFPLIVEKSTEIAKNVEEVAEADDKKEVLISGEPKETILEDDSSKFVASASTIVGTEKPLEISINDSLTQLGTHTTNESQSFKTKSSIENPTWKEVENDQKNHSTAVVVENVAEVKEVEDTPPTTAVPVEIIAEVKEEVSHVAVLEPAEEKSSDIAVTVIESSGKPDIGNFSDSLNITESQNEVRSEVANSDDEVSPKVENNGVPDVGSDDLNDGIPDVDRDGLNEISITSDSIPIEMKSIEAPVHNRDSEDDGVEVAENEPKLPTVIENTQQNTSMSSVGEQIKTQESGSTAVPSDVEETKLDIGTSTGSSLNELENSASDTGTQVPSEKSDLPRDEPDKDATEAVQ